ncbi:hypothetical protein D515_03014 [Grimontia indica]|uniref:Knr4/Smi1-like domain-containing protein n=1 Tax=Grimontia indica TaxID=1056512 RepID=R1IL67_9GAMM|nr:SMI1/KNR4 family protein [Grimontia indica]EOD78232.1 hypothetical protein D515_03014 [Grimontia indica]
MNKEKLLSFWKQEIVSTEDLGDRLSSQEAISDFEAKHGVVLPEGFKSFLTEYGACSFNDLEQNFCVYMLDVGERSVPGFVAHNFIYNVDDIEDTLFELNEELPDFWETDAALIPPTMIPIADSLADDNGYLLMNLAEKHYGSLWHWRFTQNAWGDKGNDSIILIAISFEDWLESLVTYEEAELIVAQGGSSV